jgi:hypothetical protein
MLIQSLKKTVDVYNFNIKTLIDHLKQIFSPYLHLFLLIQGA